MAPRKTDIPPYEIMRPGGREAMRQPNHAWRSPRPREQAEEGGKFSLSDWLTGGEPVSLRLPKGMALLIVAGLLLLIMIAYWVGQSRGRAAADSRYQKQMQAVQDYRSSAAPLVVDPTAADSDGAGAGASSRAPSGGGGAAVTRTTDPRQKGLNYPILVYCTLPEAKRLGAFLAQGGVDTFIISGKNEELYHLVGLHGLRGDGGFRAAREEYETKLKRLGREWKAQNGGRGEDLSSIWWDKYE
ncbi:MAG: hypothetical protein IT445_16055 [Phycisphaeraceae bacterium]|nr:hypothetical protein [Phycisphaeraceae bacterium]